MAKAYLDYKGLEKVVENIKTLCGEYLPLTGGELTGDTKIVDGKTLKVENVGENTTYSKIEPEGIFIHNSDAGELDITIKSSNVDFGDNNVNTYKLTTDNFELNGKEVSSIEDEIDEDNSDNENSLATIDAIVEYVNTKVGAAFKPEVVNVLPSVGKENTFYFVPKLELKVEDKDASESSYVYPLSTSSPYITSGFVNIEAHVNIPTLASSWNVMHFTTASNANTQAGLRIINNSTGQVGLGNSTADAAAVTVTGLKAGDNILTLSYDFATKKAIMGVNGNKAERDLTLSEIRSLQFSNRSATTYKINKVYVAMSGAAASGPNIYDEYIYIGNRWEQIGSTEVTFGLATEKVDGLMYHGDKAFLDKISENIKYVGDDNSNFQIEDSGNYLRLSTNGGNIIMHTTDDIYLNADDFYVDADISFNKTVDEAEIYSQTGLNLSAGNSSIKAKSLLKAEEGFEAKLNTSGTTYDTTSQMKLTSGGFTISGDSVKKDGSGTTYLNQIKTSNSKMTVDAEDMSINVNKTFDVNVKNNDITLDTANGYMHIQPSGNMIYGQSKVDINSSGEMNINGTTTRVSADTYIETTGTDIRIKNSEVNIGCTNTSTSVPNSNNINMLANQQQSLTKNQTIIANSSNSAVAPKTTKVAVKEDDVVIGLERSNSNNISSLDADIDVGFKIGSDSEIKAYGPIKVYDEITSPNGGSILFDSDGWPIIKGTGGIILRADNSDASSIRIQDYIDDDTGLHQNIMINTPGKALYNAKEIATVDQIPSVSDKVAKAGDTITGAISRDSGGSWINGRDNAAIKQTKHTTSTGSSWNPVASVKTNAGNWTIGNVGDNNLTFSYDTDENYAAGRNTSAVFSITPDGAFTGSVSNADHASSADTAEVAEGVESESSVTIKSYNSSVNIKPETSFNVETSSDVNITCDETNIYSDGDSYFYGHYGAYDSGSGGSMINLCDNIVLSAYDDIRLQAGPQNDLDKIYIGASGLVLNNIPEGMLIHPTKDGTNQESIIMHYKASENPGSKWTASSLPSGNDEDEWGDITGANNDGIMIAAHDGSEESGIILNGDNICMWSPADNDAIRYWDGDGGPEDGFVFRITSSGNLNTALSSAGYGRSGIPSYNGTSTRYVKFRPYGTSDDVIMIAWGTAKVSGDNYAYITFPLSFSEMPSVSLAGVKGEAWYSAMPSLGEVRNGGFYAVRRGAYSFGEDATTISWIAIGRA